MPAENLLGPENGGFICSDSSAVASAHRLTVFIGASLALILASAISVLAGGVISAYVDPKYLSYAAGIGFMVIGALTIALA